MTSNPPQQSDKLEEILRSVENHGQNTHCGFVIKEPFTSPASAKVALLNREHTIRLEMLAKHASDLARGVGLLEGLKYPDKYLTKRLKTVMDEIAAIDKARGKA